MARPLSYTPEIADRICDQLVCGKSLASICRDQNSPGYSTVMRWANDIPEFREKYARARDEQGEADADAVSDIAQRVLDGEIDPQTGRVAIEAYKWTAGKRRPIKYGERATRVLEGGEKPIQTQDVIELGPDGKPVGFNARHTARLLFAVLQDAKMQVEAEAGGDAE